LLRFEQIDDLIGKIAAQGYFPTEALICIQEDSRLLVVEGNRRLASLKLLLNPELAPESDQKAVRVKAKKMTVPVPKEVTIVLAPSRLATAPIVMDKHTHEGVRSWKPFQQAKYVESLAGDMSIDEISKITSFPKGEILRNIRTYTMYQLAGVLDLDPSDLQIVKDPRRFNASTLERILDVPATRTYLGISFDERGKVAGTIHPNDFKERYKRLIGPIAKGEIDTRGLNKSQDVEKYIGGLELPKPRRKGSFTSDSLLGKSAGVDATVSVRASVPRVRRRPDSAYLIPRSFKCNLADPRIQKILDELHHLHVDKFENATSVLLRIFVELSIYHYLESTGSLKSLIAKLNLRGKRPKNWSPTLREMLQFLLDQNPTIDLSPQAMKALRKAVSDNDHPLSLDSLDQFVHNKYVAPEEKQLRNFWNLFEKLLVFLMSDNAQTIPAKGTRT